MEKIEALKVQCGDFDRRMAITTGMKFDLQWWTANIFSQDRKIFRTGTNIDLFTDASSLGWGGHLDQMTTCGSWSLQEKRLHINALELKAIFLVLHTFRRALKGKHIKVFSDNTTVLAYVNEMGGTVTDF